MAKKKKLRRQEPVNDGKSKWTVGIVEIDGALRQADIHYVEGVNGQPLILEMNVYPTPLTPPSDLN